VWWDIIFDAHETAPISTASFFTLKRLIMKKCLFICLSGVVIVFLAAHDGLAVDNGLTADKHTGILLTQFFPNDPTPFKRFRYRKPSKRTKEKSVQKTARYQSLVTDLQRILLLKTYDAMTQIQNLDVLLYWQMGARLSEEDSTTITEGYVSTLSRDINLDRDLLNTILAFYGLYEKAEELTIDLSWEHYLQLIRVKDHEKRMLLQNEAVHRKWTAADLKARVIRE
jgi:DUF1016 N-terminal domain